MVHIEARPGVSQPNNERISLNPSGVIFESGRSLLRDVTTGLVDLERGRIIHVAGEIYARGYFVAAPFAHTGEVEKLNITAAQIGAELLLLAPEVLEAEVLEDGTTIFPYIRFNRKNGQKEERVGILLVPTEAFARSIVRYENRKKGSLKNGALDLVFEERSEMVTSQELDLMLHNQSLHSEEYRRRHSRHKKKAAV